MLPHPEFRYFATRDFTLCSPTPAERPASMLRYDAPELLTGDVLSAAVDVWAFGCVLSEMLTGEQHGAHQETYTHCGNIEI